MLLDLHVNGSHTLAMTAASFLGVNIDSASLYQNTRLDFRDADLRVLSKRLGHALLNERMPLRIGGSSADDLRLASDTVAAHGQILLPLDYFDTLLEFVGDCAFKLAWDLNGMRMRDDDGEWNSSAARVLLGRAGPRGLWAVQLGNEPGHFETRHGAPTAAAHGHDYRALRALLDEMFPNATRPRIQGPGICNGNGTDTSPCANVTYLRRLLVAAGPETIDDLTVQAMV